MHAMLHREDCHAALELLNADRAAVPKASNGRSCTSWEQPAESQKRLAYPEACCCHHVEDGDMSKPIAIMSCT